MFALFNVSSMSLESCSSKYWAVSFLLFRLASRRFFASFVPRLLRGRRREFDTWNSRSRVTAGGGAAKALKRLHGWPLAESRVEGSRCILKGELER